MTETTRRTLLKTGLAGGAGALAGPVLWTQPGWSAVAPSGIHLSYGLTPRSAMNVSWSTPRSVRKPVLDLGTTTRYGRTVGADSVSSLGVDTVYHHVGLHDLRPGTTYHYRLRHAGGTVRAGTFRTPPRGQRAFRFAAFGDMGVNTAAAKHVALLNRQKPAFAFVVGDLCYADSGGMGTSSRSQQDFGVWDTWLRQIQPSARAIPWMTTVGNHEMENGNGELGYAGYFARFRNPRNGVKGGRATYSFVHGNVAFVALDGNDATYEYTRNNGYLGSALDHWLDSRLRYLRGRDDVDFIVVGFHQCAYCTNMAHASDGGVRDRWEAIFDKHQVDLVVNGHNHCYERTHLMRDGSPVQEAPKGGTVTTNKGTVYVTAGGAGASAYPEVGLPTSYVTVRGGLKVPEITTWNAVASAEHSIAFLDVTPPNKWGTATMKLRTLSTSGAVLDTLTMRRTS
ncbi:metallophosphoesterase family protein [Nocardioides sp. KR10-350]|uniref:purple acid phosphatase family protein n=1 Tax=Nocardioides cheoyonin TaxID=3156615 RepID=UPI0032B3D704